MIDDEETDKIKKLISSGKSDCEIGASPYNPFRFTSSARPSGHAASSFSGSGQR